MHSHIRLDDAIKTYTFDQDKALDPVQTIRRVHETFRRANLDVLKETKRIDSGRLDIPVYVSLCGSEALRTIGTKKQMGKGATPQQAEASALMELVERFSFFRFLRNHPFIVSDLEAVAADAMPLESIAEAVHHDPGDLDRAREALKQVVLRWAWGRNLTREKDMLVPVTWFYEINQFNGPSAGNLMEEAIVQGVCEVVERHVSALVCRLKRPVPFIDLDSVRNEAALDLIEKYRTKGIELYIKDFTLDMGIPSVGALAWDPTTFPERSEIVFTAGTAPDPEKALIRALTEVAQLAGDFDTAGEYVASGLPKPGSPADVPYMTEKTLPDVRIKDMPNLSDRNMRVEVERCVRALDRSGYEVYVLNTTQPELEIPAVYTMIPGCLFRERARGTSVPFFAAKIITQTFSPPEALERLTRIGELYPDRYYLYYYQGVCLANMGNHEAALARFREALDRNPEAEDAPTIQCYVGICRKDLEEYEQAIEELEKAVLLDPECKEAYNAMGYCHFKLKQHHDAIRCFEHAVRIDPGSAIDYANIGSNLRELGQIEEAIRLYRIALELDDTIDFARENIEILTRKRSAILRGSTNRP